MERELWKQLYGIVMTLDRVWSNGLFQARDIVLVFLWAVIHDRPTRWACRASNWGEESFRWLPSQSTMSRRLRSTAVVQLLAALEAHLGGDARRWWLARLDSKPLPVGTCSKDPEAKWGYATKCLARGYKLHAVWGSGSLPAVWSVESMNVGDAKAAGPLLEKLPGAGYVVADAQYDSNHLYSAAAPHHQLIAPQQRPGKALGHRRHHPARIRSLELQTRPFGQALVHSRGQIERDFSQLTSCAGGLSPLPSWVRRLTRVRLWVQAKLLINAVRHRQNRLEPKIATA